MPHWPKLGCIFLKSLGPGKRRRNPALVFCTSWNMAEYLNRLTSARKKGKRMDSILNRPQWLFQRFNRKCPCHQLYHSHQDKFYVTISRSSLLKVRDSYERTSQPRLMRFKYAAGYSTLSKGDWAGNSWMNELEGLPFDWSFLTQIKLWASLLLAFYNIDSRS